MLETIVTHFIALVVGLAGGAYIWYRFGSKLATDAQTIRTDVKKL